MTQGFREFEFDLPDALLHSIIKAFDTMESAPLSPNDVKVIPDAQGVYQLLLNNQIVYIGKTDSEAGLQRRLERHAWTIQHRRNLSVDQVTFKAIRVFVFTAMDLETQLIRHYRDRSTISWNNSGFGSNDPGRNRDFTRAVPNSFDMLYPLNIDEPVKMTVSGRTSVKNALLSLRAALPYGLRIESSGNHEDLSSHFVNLPATPTSSRKILELILSETPVGWQATALAGRIVLYKERREDYPENRVIARS